MSKKLTVMMKLKLIWYHTKYTTAVNDYSEHKEYIQMYNNI
jgi:hypothetical protein